MRGDLADQTEPKADDPREAWSVQERTKPCSERGLPGLASFRLLVSIFEKVLEMSGPRQYADFPNGEPTVHQIPASLRLSRELGEWR